MQRKWCNCRLIVDFYPRYNHRDICRASNCRLMYLYTAAVLQHRIASSVHVTYMLRASLHRSCRTKLEPYLLRSRATAESDATVTISHLAGTAPGQERLVPVTKNAISERPTGLAVTRAVISDLRALFHIRSRSNDVP